MALVASVTVRPECPAFASRLLAWPMSWTRSGQCRVVHDVPKTEHVVADPAVPTEDRVQHLLAVADQAEGLADANVVERRPVDTHGEGRVPAAVGDDHIVAARADRGDRVRGYAVYDIERATSQRVDLADLTREVPNDEPVDVGQAALPVVLVLHEGALAACGERLEPERPGADRSPQVEANGHDEEVVRAQDVLQRRKRREARDLDGEPVELLRVGDVEGLERCGTERRLFRVDDPLEGEQDVIGAERLAVVELDVRQQADRPFRGVLARC